MPEPAAGRLAAAAGRRRAPGRRAGRAGRAGRACRVCWLFGITAGQWLYWDAGRRAVLDALDEQWVERGAGWVKPTDEPRGLTIG
jgi:hypothetical protein